MYFESHAHYDDKRFDRDREKILNDLANNGIDFCINIGVCMKSSKNSIELATKYPNIYAAVGVHPHEVEHMNEKDMDLLESYTKNEKVVAIGEIGLDFFYDHSPQEKQRYWFKKQLELAEQLDYPVVIHSRDADMDVFKIIKESNVRKGVIHCYSGSRELAMEYVKLGFHIGVGGVVTFKNARRLVESVEVIPMKNILIETDCPYLSPEPKRGERNTSENLKIIVDKISEIKKLSHEETSFITMENAKKLFFIK